MSRKQTFPQARASKENWARLQLKGMQSHARLLASQGFILPGELDMILAGVEMAECRIINVQRFRQKVKLNGKTK